CQYQQPLVALTKKDAFKWNPLAELAYHKLKEAMVKALVLALPNFEQEFVVETDVSGKGIGAVLCQNGHPIAYWSKTLSARHQALSTYEKEFLAVIVYNKGSENVEADALSRMDSSGELLQIFVSSVSTIGGHSGAHVTIKKLGSLFYWKGLKKMVKQMVRDCDVCQRQKPDLSAYPGLIQPLPIPERIWKEISMDSIEKLPTSHGKSVILVVVDRLSKSSNGITTPPPIILLGFKRGLRLPPDQIQITSALPAQLVDVPPVGDSAQTVLEISGMYMKNTPLMITNVVNNQGALMQVR
ncbi:putative mitochondrial protein, partial [Tanacetum coccineum]